MPGAGALSADPERSVAGDLVVRCRATARQSLAPAVVASAVERRALARQQHPHVAGSDIGCLNGTSHIAAYTVGATTGERSTMAGNQRKPTLFVGSSSEGLEWARALQRSLTFDCDPQVW